MQESYCLHTLFRNRHKDVKASGASLCITGFAQARKQSEKIDAAEMSARHMLWHRLLFVSRDRQIATDREETHLRTLQAKHSTAVSCRSPPLKCLLTVARSYTLTVSL